MKLTRQRQTTRLPVAPGPLLPPSNSRPSNDQSSKIARLRERIYIAWFSFSKSIVDFFGKRDLVPLGSSLGVVLSEGDTLVRAAWHTRMKYSKDPKEYGLNTITDTHRGKTPVIILHGAAGSWNYLGDLATKMMTAGVPVFVIDLGFGSPTDEMRGQLLAQVEQIKSECRQRFGQETQVDLVAHSMGGNIAFAAAFSTDTSKINGEGNLTFTSTNPKANPGIRRVLTLALPSTSGEKALMEGIGKRSDLFNINAKYDALMGHKKCGLDDRQVQVVDCGHIGIVYSQDAQEKVCEFIKHGAQK